MLLLRHTLIRFGTRVPVRFASSASAAARRTPLYDFHLKHEGDMVEFAGWSMPVKYKSLGVLASHLHTRENASLFDVSHMLQSRVTGRDRIAFFESLIVADLQQLPEQHSTLSLFTNQQGGIIDDLIVTKEADSLYVVTNAACAEKDWAYMQEQLNRFKEQNKDADVKIEPISDHALLALQGPKAATVLERILGYSLADVGFMTARNITLDGIPCHLARGGYTGEDGFEIAVPESKAARIAELLVAQPEVALAGLGARDSLRLEAGMCLYGHDLDETTTPIEAGLLWTIGKRRRVEGGFPGFERIREQIEQGVTRRRVGLIVEGAPAREGATILNTEGEVIGTVTSGCPSPSLKKNIAMGYVKKEFSKVGTPLQVQVRQRVQPAQIVKMPFVPNRYHKI